MCTVPDLPPALPVRRNCAADPCHACDALHALAGEVAGDEHGVACLPVLPNSEICLRGARTQEYRATEAAPLKNALLLFPSEDAVELTPAWLALQPRPVTLVVPDGSWNQAKKVPFRESGLAGIPKVKLAVGAPSCYRLRYSPHVQNFSTLEAIARALGVIEGHEVQVPLESLFLKMVERRLWSMGQLRPEERVTVIPEEAILASRREAAAGGRKKTPLSHRATCNP